jgi:hypothetical protein
MGGRDSRNVSLSLHAGLADADDAIVGGYPEGFRLPNAPLVDNLLFGPGR